MVNADAFYFQLDRLTSAEVAEQTMNIQTIILKNC